MLGRHLLRAYSTCQWTPTTPPPSPRLDRLRAETLTLIQRDALIGGITAGLSTCTLAYTLEMGGGLFVGTIAALGAGIGTGWWQFNRQPEIQILHLTQKYYELETEFKQIQDEQSNRVVLSDLGIDRVQEKLIEIHYDQPFPLVHTFKQWKEQDSTLTQLKKHVQQIGGQHRCTNSRVDPAYRTQLGSGLPGAIQELQNQIETSMVMIKRCPDWRAQLSDYYLKKTKDIAKETRAVATETLHAANRAAADAELAKIYARTGTFRRR